MRDRDADRQRTPDGRTPDRSGRSGVSSQPGAGWVGSYPDGRVSRPGPAETLRPGEVPLSEISTQRISSVSVAQAEQPASAPSAAASASTAPPEARTVRLLRLGGIALAVAVQTLLLILSLVPSSIATRLNWSSTNGPFPAETAPLVTLVFYLAPTVAGFLARRWDLALAAATFPAWLSIAVYSVAASSQNGIFALTAGAHPSYLVGTMELFAALGAFGWLAWRVTPRFGGGAAL